ncbi:hypothetical protein VVT58_05475 [Sphingobium sp. SJ10-10]|uniref:hypothetical protein n=1 Tax=Sphingobium sp. SJ10-10 TaxID=3114999 RepID=UPI002E171A71|nr:hypothetical protein [Sphingobium sp. SJ10-10]
MEVSTFTDWIAWGGLVVPLCALAWSAVQYVTSQRREQAFREFEKFFSLMTKLGSKENSRFEAVAILYELRKFPQYADVLERTLRGIDTGGPDAVMLKTEIDLLLEKFGK